MLWGASALDGYAIEASDGRIGSVSDFLFEDTSWKVRWLVVDTGGWLSGRKVLLPLSVLGKPDPSRNQFPVKLTMQRVKDSPDIDTDLPVSRQHETHIYGHYRWNPYWDSDPPPIGGGIALPSIEAPNTIGDNAQQDDAHLRSVKSVIGFHVHATDGQIGHVADFLIDDADWSIRYAMVDTTNWWPGGRVLIAPRAVRNIDRPNRLIHLDVDRQKVKDSPPYDPSKTVDGAYDEAFLWYYGIRWTKA